MSAQNPIADIVDNGLCTGCGACVSALKRPDIAMELAEPGYLRPRAAPLSPAETKTLHAVCAGREIAGRQLDPKADYHPVWGPIVTLATGHATDPQVRYRGSSGGVISALAIALIESGAVEFVLATHADPDEPLGNVTRALGSRDEILAAAGSRYAPSSPLADLETHLAKGRKFAVIGKPCDIASLRRMARHDPRIDALIPYKLAFFCAGVPSRAGTVEVLRALGVERQAVATFQYRGNGWPGLAKATLHSGEEASMDYNSSWGQILNRHLQFRCKICPDGTGESADVVCADAWYGADGYPDFTERDGRSLIVARTQAGQALVDQVAKEGRVAMDPLPVADIALMQPYQLLRKSNVIARLIGLWMARRHIPRFRGLKLLRLATRTSPETQARNLWGTFRRSGGKRLI